MKVQSSVKPMCKECQIIKREGVVHNRCKVNARHNQRQG